MIAHIKLVINDTLPVIKPKYITVIHEANTGDRLFKIKSINNNLCCIEDIATGTEVTCSSDILKNCIKLIAVCDKIALPVIYRDVLPIIKKHIKDMDVDTKLSFLSKFISGSEEIVVNGKEYKSWVNVLPKQSVEITSLSIIDKYKLYTVQSRIFKVEMIDYPVNNKLSDKTFTLMNDGLKIICKRSDFKTIDKINYKKLFTIQ